MYFDSLADFIAMGGHGLYVWLAYSIALVIVVFNIASPILRKRQFMANYRKRLQREQRLAQRQTSETQK
ncbi:MAG: heme exporter protein CcmD [Motiliproteus sp.]